MTNEELVQAIKQGNTNLYALLWEQVYKLLYSIARKYYNRHTGQLSSAGVTLDDLYQEYYFAMLDAVKAYDSAKGYSFTSYFKFYTKNRFNMLAGFRTAKGRRDLLTSSTSLDTPMRDNEDCTLADVTPNENALHDIENVDEKLYLQQLHTDLQACLDTLEPLQRAAVVGRFYHGASISELSAQMGVEPKQAQQLATKGLCKLRTGKCITILKSYRDEIMSAYRFSVGLSSFRRDNVSVEQRILEFKEQVRC